MDSFDRDVKEDFGNEEPIVIRMEQIKSLLETQIIAKTLIFMFVAFLITALACKFTNEECVKEMCLHRIVFLPIIVHIGVFIVGKMAIDKEITILVTILYVAHSILTGVNLSILTLGYFNGIFIATFIIMAVVFLITAIYGWDRDINLGCVRTALWMGFIGVILTIIVNICCLKNERVTIVANSVGVLILVVMTSHGIHNVRERLANTKEDNVFALALYGAFELYIGFYFSFMELIGALVEKISFGTSEEEDTYDCTYCDDDDD